MFHSRIQPYVYDVRKRIILNWSNCGISAYQRRKRTQLIHSFALKIILLFNGCSDPFRITTISRLNILPSHQPREDYLSNYLFTRIHSHQIALKQNPYLEEKMCYTSIQTHSNYEHEQTRHKYTLYNQNTHKERDSKWQQLDLNFWKKSQGGGKEKTTGCA